MIKFFDANYLTEELDLPYNKALVFHDEEKTRGRWYTIHKMVFEDGGKYWEVEYHRGLTELQEMDPWPTNSQVRAVEVFQNLRLFKL